METVAVRQVFSGDEWIELKRDLSLSPRQADVVEQLLQGHSDKQIAHELQMSVPTVRTHLCRLFTRFGVEDRCELIVHVYRRFREKCQACGCPRANGAHHEGYTPAETAVSCLPAVV
jgi:DNA-binding CsgD family transcriptional regulator